MQVEIAIVGAGIAGAATAFHLRRLGVTGVVLLEKEDAPGQHSTARNAAILREHTSDAALQPLAAEGAEQIRSGAYCAFNPVGGMLLGRGDSDVSLHFPPAAGTGLWSPRDGVADPAGLLATYLRGQQVLCNTAVHSWRGDGRGGAVMHTSSGEIRTRVVVNASGPWAGALGGLPLEPRNRHLFLTPPMPQIDPAWPWVWDLDAGLYFRPEGGGLLLCPCDEEVRPPGQYRVDHRQYARLADLLARTQPRLRDVAIRLCWTGQRTFAPDSRFVIGFDPRDPATFHVCGLGGHGITTSYAVGRLAAELLAGVRPPGDNPFSPQRILTRPGG